MAVKEDDVLRVVLEYAIPASSQVLNVFYFIVVGNPPSDEAVLTDLLEWAQTVWGDAWADIASSQADITGMTVDVLDPVTGDVLENVGTPTIAVTGTVADQVNAAAVAGYIKGDTQFPKTRGSKYVPGIGEALTETGLFNSTAVTGLLALLDIYLTVYAGVESGVDFRPGVISRALAAWVAFQGGGSTTDVPAYQRRRKPNVGS